MNSTERKIVGIISAAHFYSHFYFVVLPLMFPILKEVYNISYTELGIGYGVFSATTAICQAPVGYVVDRYGARWILISGIIGESIILALFGVFHSYVAYIVLMALAGLANSVYHPADYSILTRSVRKNRLGKAFSIHTFSGQAGSACSPLVVVLIGMGVDWSYSLQIAGLMGLLIAVVVIMGSSNIDQQMDALEQPVVSRKIQKGSWRLLFNVPILLGWLFFIGFSMGTSGIYDFSVSAFTEIYDATLGEATTVMWLFLVAVAIGIFSAGFVADRFTHHELVAISCCIGVAVVMFFIAFVPMPLFVLAIPMVIAGFFEGFITPSRDIIISSLGSPKDMGKIFGIVTTGFSVGGILGPPLFGYLLDLGDPHSIFWGAGVISLLTILTLLRPATQKMKLSSTTQTGD